MGEDGFLWERSDWLRLFLSFYYRGKQIKNPQKIAGRKVVAAERVSCGFQQEVRGNSFPPKTQKIPRIRKQKKNSLAPKKLVKELVSCHGNCQNLLYE